MPTTLPITASPLGRHAARWGDCQRCELCHARKYVVLCRGQVPCDVLFIGEAPGISENRLGYPFAGPAGILLDKFIARAWGEPPPVRYAFTNLVACIPLQTEGENRGRKVDEPNSEDVRACSGRLVEFIQLCSPLVIVCVGACATHYLTGKGLDGIKLHRPVRTVEIVHPAYILRANVAQQGFLYQKTVVQLRGILETLEGGEA